MHALCFARKDMFRLYTLRHRIVYLKGRKGRGKVTQKAKVRAEGEVNRKKATMFCERKIRC